MQPNFPIIVRDPSFAHERGPGGLWNVRLPELSHTLNGFQRALPYLEPYLIDAIRSARAAVVQQIASRLHSSATQSTSA